MSDERWGGIKVIQKNAFDCPCFNLHYSFAWYADESDLTSDVESNPRYKQNFTVGHEGDANHLWLLSHKEVYVAQPGNEFDAICILYYRPVNPDFLRKYSKSLV